MDEHEHAAKPENPAVQRVRQHFHQCPVVYSDDPKAMPQPVFPITDFVANVHSSLIEDIAEAFLETKQFSDVHVFVGTANRCVGAIVHELARRTDRPYTLANWYPAGSIGETLVAECGGFSGKGAVYLNGLRPGQRVALVIDVLRSGSNVLDLVHACERAGVFLVGCYCVASIIEFPGRSVVHRHFDSLACPFIVLVTVSARGERTKIVGSDGSTLLPSPPWTAAMSRLSVDDVLSPTAHGRARRLFPVPASFPTVRGFSNDALAAKRRRISEPFYNIPVVRNPLLNYPYCFFQLTDFVPLMTCDMIEDVADLCVQNADFNRCDVIVSEADRGGAPLAVAISRRTGKPFVLASWSTIVDSQCSDATSVGFSGFGRFFIAGVKNGERCIFVDDMLSSGGTCEGIVNALRRCGAVTLEAIFVGEKLTAPAPNGVLPRRTGFQRLANAAPDMLVTTLVQLTAFGPKTEPPVATVG